MLQNFIRISYPQTLGSERGISKMLMSSWSEELLNFRFSLNYPSFNVWVRYPAWNFKGYLWNSTQNVSPIQWKMWYLYNIENFRALKFKSSNGFLKPPEHSTWSPQGIKAKRTIWNSLMSLFFSSIMASHELFCCINISCRSCGISFWRDDSHFFVIWAETNRIFNSQAPEQNTVTAKTL